MGESRRLDFVRKVMDAIARRSSYRMIARPQTLGSAYVAAISIGGLLVIVASIHELAVTSPGMSWFILAALTVLGGSATLTLPSIPVSFSISDSFTITTALLFGPAAGAVTVAIDGLVISLQLSKRESPLRRLLFNATAPALAMWVAARGFFLLAGVGPLIRPSLPVESLMGPLAVFAALYFVLNTALIAVAVALERGAKPLVIWRRHFMPLWLTYFGGAIVAALLIVLVYSRGADLTMLTLVAPIPLILYLTFKNTVGRMKDQAAHLGQMNRMYFATIETLVNAIDAKDQVTHGHIRRVQHYAMRLAKALGIDQEAEGRALEAASLLHDMGKLAVPEHILNKPGKLTATEFAKMKLHTTIGADILSSIDFPDPVVPIVRHHHENWDGTGYPSGLKGDAIPLGARILSVVDCYDALTSDRPYRPKMPPTEAIQILKQRSGTMYDPQIVAKFVQIHEAGGPEPPRAVAFEALSAISRTLHSDAGRLPGRMEPHDRLALAVMYDLGNLMVATQDLWTATHRLHDSLKKIMPTSCTVIYTYDPAADQLVARHLAGQHSSDLHGLAIPLGQRLTGWVAANRTTIVNSEAALDLGNLAMKLTPPPEACLSTAICIDDELVGALTLYASSPQPFTDADGEVVEILASRLATIVRRASLSSAEDRRKISKAMAI